MADWEPTGHYDCLTVGAYRNWLGRIPGHLRRD